MLCRACNSECWTFLYLGPMPLINRFLKTKNEPETFFPLNVMKCRKCHLIQLDYTVEPEVLFRDYTYTPSSSVTMIEHFKVLCSDILSMHKKKRPFIVEIASNDGTLLSNFSGKDAKILGIEPSVNIAKIANDKGIPTLNDFFSNKIAKKVVSTHGMANIIVGTNVLAHVPGIRDFVLAVKELLSKEGFAVFEFPYLLDLIEKVEFDTIYHEHIFYLSISPLSALFNEAGMEIFEVKKTDVHGGSIQIYIQHKNGPHKLTSSTKKFIQLEKEKGLLEEKTYLSFASKVKSLRSSIYDLLNKIKSKGRTIAAYGAAAKGNILLNYCGIEPDIIDYVVDKSPLKVGKFTPGKRFPVLPVETLKKRTPEYLLILPWNLSNEIMTQEAWFAKTGGKFIVPIPEIKCIGNQIDR